MMTLPLASRCTSSSGRSWSVLTTMEWTKVSWMGSVGVENSVGSRASVD